MVKVRACWALSLAAGFLVVTPAAHAGLILTQAGTDAGFTLSTFATGFPVVAGILGPLGVAFPSSGGVMVTDYAGNVRVFASDADGQSASSATIGQSAGTSHAVGLTSLNGTIYMSDQGGTIKRLNNNGTTAATLTSFTQATGITNDGTYLYADGGTGTSGLYRVDPSTGSRTLISNSFYDGLMVDSTTNTLYGARSDGHVIGFNLSTFSQTYDSGFIPNDPDGIAVGFGSLAGKMYVNTNGGVVYELNLSTSALTAIATGGSRGDFVAVDPNGSLLLTQTDRIMRLTPGSGATFVASPEPSTMLSLVGGLGLLGLMRRKR